LQLWSKGLFVFASPKVNQLSLPDGIVDLFDMRSVLIPVYMAFPKAVDLVLIGFGCIPG